MNLQMYNTPGLFLDYCAGHEITISIDDEKGRDTIYFISNGMQHNSTNIDELTGRIHSLFSNLADDEFYKIKKRANLVYNNLIEKVFKPLESWYKNPTSYTRLYTINNYYCRFSLNTKQDYMVLSPRDTIELLNRNDDWQLI